VKIKDITLCMANIVRKRGLFTPVNDKNAQAAHVVPGMDSDADHRLPLYGTFRGTHYIAGETDNTQTMTVPGRRYSSH
jgi:hypothetical protein